MKQQINLYLPEFRVKKDSISTLLISQVVGGVVLTMLVISIFDIFTRWELGGELDRLQASLVEETRKTSQLDEQLARRSQNSELVDQLRRAESRLTASRSIRDFLSETKLGNVTGFSEYFKDISRASVDGLSVQDFEISDGGDGVRIIGEVMDSALVPRFVDNIEAGQSSLRSQRFSSKISRAGAEARVFSFELSNQSE
ncbi:MAG: hypothetical protein ACI95C_002804 [Pseudohongiellaceae bacterium]|jgi:hypothetical protein